MHKIALLAVATALLAVVAMAPATAATRPKANIVETAVAAGQFKTLTSLVEQAGLAGALSGNAQLTVFAPTDEAFAKVPQSTLDALAADPEALRAVLTYHVAKGRLTAKTVARRKSIKTLNGKRVSVRVRGKTVRVGGARVVKANIAASNGVIHVIDRVLNP